MDLSLKLSGLEKVPEDSAIYVKGDNIKKVLFGIDAAVPELLFAKQYGYEAVIAHHPQGGTAILNYHKVFRRHIQQMMAVGISKEEATRAAKRKTEELETDGHTKDYGHSVDMAKLLKMPYMNVHTPLDEVGRRIMAEQINRSIKKNSTVKDVVLALKELPEFQNAITEIKIRLGRAENPAGKVVISHGAGTNGGYQIAKTYFEHGVGTLVYIHVSFGDLEKLRADQRGNLIVTGHIASDSVGINPFLQELKKKGVSVSTTGIVLGE
jgi:putative NIF3 family GTP cyclohydrolase 1 type 2